MLHRRGLMHSAPDNLALNYQSCNVQVQLFSPVAQADEKAHGSSSREASLQQGHDGISNQLISDQA